MLFNPNLTVPDNLREKQLKDRQRAKLANPFTTRRVKEKTAKEQHAVEAANWKPKFCSFTAPQAGSTVAMAMAKSGLNGQQQHWCRQPTRKRLCSGQSIPNG